MLNKTYGGAAFASASAHNTTNVVINNDKTPEYAEHYRKVREEVMRDIIASGTVKMFDKPVRFVVSRGMWGTNVVACFGDIVAESEVFPREDIEKVVKNLMSDLAEKLFQALSPSEVDEFILTMRASGEHI